jgi:hypothetical protein
MPALPTSHVLLEALPDSINELFSRHPEQYSDPDLDRMIEVLRQQRERYQHAEAMGIKPSKPVKLTQPKFDINGEPITSLGF